MNKKKNKQQINIISIMCVIVLIIIVSMIVTNIKKSQKENELLNRDIHVVQQEIKNEIAVNHLSDKGERDRMEYYVSEFIEAVEDKKYEEAYGMLYDEFKTNYFSTLDKFETYCRKTFPKMFSVEYDNIERNGDIYVLWVTINDALNGNKTTSKQINFVVKENDLNDFVLSFSAE